jgi:hypothetical protein
VAYCLQQQQQQGHCPLSQLAGKQKRDYKSQFCLNTFVLITVSLLQFRITFIQHCYHSSFLNCLRANSSNLIVFVCLERIRHRDVNKAIASKTTINIQEERSSSREILAEMLALHFRSPY